MAENDFQFRRTRGGNKAPWQPIALNDFRPPTLPDDRPEDSGHQTALAPAPRRAAPQAYFLDQRIVGLSPPGAETLPEGTVVIPERQVFPPLAARPAYTVITGKPYDEERIVELGNGYSDLRPRPKPRAAPAAYEPVNVTFPPPELVPVGLLARVDLRQLSPRPAPASAYWFPFTPVPADPNIPIAPKLGDPPFLILPRRAARTAYGLTERNGPQIPEESVPPAVQLCPRRAPGYRRAARQVYLAGGGVVDLLRDGAPSPGCPYRPGFPDAGSTYFARVDEVTGYIGRADEGSIYPARVDECH